MLLSSSFRDHHFAQATVLVGYKAIIISGGPESVYDPSAPKLDKEVSLRAVMPTDRLTLQLESFPRARRCAAVLAKQVLSLGKPVLGICYGMQLLNYHNDGTVEKGSIREDGQASISINVRPTRSCPMPSCAAYRMASPCSVTLRVV